MAEIEFSVLSRSCLKQRLSGEGGKSMLVTERNAARATINWRINTRDARTKLTAFTLPILRLTEY